MGFPQIVYFFTGVLVGVVGLMALAFAVVRLKERDAEITRLRTDLASLRTEVFGTNIGAGMSGVNGIRPEHLKPR